MLIAVSQNNDKNKHGDFIDSLENNYINYLEKFGIKLLIIPNSVENVDYYFNLFPVAGIILSGGNDVNPELYGAVSGENSSLAIVRDNTEKRILEIAVEKKIPVFGICRGMQFINVFFAGGLVNLNENEMVHPIENHEINIVNDKAREVLGDKLIVNSYHNLGVTKKTLSSQLKAFAVSKDKKAIEGIYHPDLPIVGIQWHPERSNPDSEFNEKLVKMFMEGNCFWRSKKKIKAIILAAGMGTRLGKYTENRPKCMLNFNRKTLIEQQVEQLRKAGITDITIVKGYMPDKINVPGTKTCINKDYANTNMVETLFCAEEEMDDDLLICYADILYEDRILKKVLASNVDVGVTVDEDYWEYWQARVDNPEDDMESLVIEDEKIVDLGNPNCTREEAKVRYVGLIKFSKAGVDILKKVYHENKEKYFHLDQPWLRSKSFKKAYMTCILQAIINSGQKVEPIIINRGWLEFDTVKDYEKYNFWLENGSLNRFFKLSLDIKI